jgi:hypothetical protein
MRDRRGHRAAVALFGALALAMTACSAGDDASDMPAVDEGSGSRSSTAAEAPMSDADAADDMAADDAGEGAVAGEPTAPGASSAQAGRRVIRTAELVLELDDPAAAAEEVVRIAEAAGGFVATADLSRDAEGVVSGSLTLRVPSDQLLPTVDALDALAQAVPVRRIDEVDVTSESADLEAQLTNLSAYEAELRDLLADVSDTSDRASDLLTVFERIRSVREEIDRIQARLDVLADQVQLSTITVTLVPASSALPVSDPTWSPGSTVREALSATTRALSRIADGAIWIALTVLPVVLVMALPVVIAFLVWRSLRRRRRARWSPPVPPTNDAAPSGMAAPEPSPAGTAEPHPDPSRDAPTEAPARGDTPPPEPDPDTENP